MSFEDWIDVEEAAEKLSVSVEEVERLVADNTIRSEMWGSTRMLCGLDVRLHLEMLEYDRASPEAQREMERRERPCGSVGVWESGSDGVVECWSDGPSTRTSTRTRTTVGQFERRTDEFGHALVTVEAAGELLGLSVGTIRRLLESGRLNSDRVGRRRWILLEDVERYAESRREWEDHGLSKAPSDCTRWWEPKGGGMVAVGRRQEPGGGHESVGLWECGSEKDSDQLSVISDQSSRKGESEKSFVRGWDRWITSKEAAVILRVRPLRVNVLALQGKLRRRLEGAGGSLQEAGGHGGVGVWECGSGEDTPDSNQLAQGDHSGVGGRGKRAWFLLSEALRLADARASEEWRRGISPRDWNYDLMHPVIRTRIEAPVGDRLISPLEAGQILDVGRKRIYELVTRGRLFGWQTEPGKRGVRLWLSENQVRRYRDNPARIMARKKLLNGRKEEEEFDQWREWLGLGHPSKRSNIDREHGEYFNTQQAAKVLGVHIKTVGRLRKRGRLQGYRRSRKRRTAGNQWWFYRKDDVYDLMSEAKYARNSARGKKCSPKLWAMIEARRQEAGSRRQEEEEDRPW